MKKVSHFYREPLKVIKKYTDEELDARWDDEGEFQPEALRFIYCMVDESELLECLAIPGGSARLPLHLASRLKISGVRAGVLDLELLWRNRGVAFIELKARTAPSAAQLEFLAYLELTGHQGAVCRTLREILEFLKKLNLTSHKT